MIFTDQLAHLNIPADVRRRQRSGRARREDEDRQRDDRGRGWQPEGHDAADLRAPVRLAAPLDPAEVRAHHQRARDQPAGDPVPGQRAR